MPLLRTLVLLGGLLISGAAMAADTTKTAHDFAFTAIDGAPLALKSFAGKVVMVVNTASQCGFTPQYTALQDLWSRYRDKGFVLLSVPSNDFGGQEPGSSAEIKEFCEVNFSVDFPLTEKVRVKGPDAHPFYQWAGKELGALAKPRWNFHKYLIGLDGRLIDWFSTPTSPTAPRVIKAVEAALPE